ncbi:hypothetical protein COCC4DRAFT_66349 [Bipolaris maydis ATCC 48331]|uniref:Uncharacterized protein n=3 Tax=Cochliobolus heterostrophus TaxID=5016 RepID=M2SIN8_COCH5|nr:uncharacterized protein COCC4DRAFT_66349 [Bipolaris maydis ATCC 48331]EMD85225.1 hypothetical protein COCHEDRAFT_1035619 [Bipolaris maydis C5]KAJ5033293.1 hypothetical protein J3E74DRAFT_413694 [Bipolaris maydis]ENH99469.1 hypothetical protein COCC4DRAFT_66349 [Bipolaris maydis ATCC 48331]KAJ5041383.1 hypothetical protein J3E74DRAFT_413092 [Bipolaris maydis]KAJ5058022.1 hypothetical protein J3E74DRAFT_408277 [Bipolaris maydis]
MAKLFKYASIPDRDVTVTIKSNPAGRQDEECYLQDLLIKASRVLNARFIVAIENEHYIFHTARVTDTSVLEIEDAVSILNEFVRSGSGTSISIFCKPEDDLSSLPDKTSIHSCLVTLSHASGPFFNSLSLPIADLELLNGPSDALGKQRKSASVRKTVHSLKNAWKDRKAVRVSFWIAIGVFFLVAIAIGHKALSQPFHQHFENGIWVRYDLGGSKGPKYQLQFTHHNASAWAAKNPHDNGEWAFRIDDQAMIPAHLMDEEEELYQRWFRKRYPEKDRIRLNQDYIKDSFLGDPDQIQVPSDKQFHMAHCVRALRRYWQAKETGRHVCPRDIDYRHMKHCLDSMDEWAFPDGERGSIKPVVDSGTWKLIWETKVCF